MRKKYILYEKVFLTYGKIVLDYSKVYGISINFGKDIFEVAAGSMEIDQSGKFQKEKDWRLDLEWMKRIFIIALC